MSVKAAVRQLRRLDDAMRQTSASLEQQKSSLGSKSDDAPFTAPEYQLDRAAAVAKRADLRSKLASRPNRFTLITPPSASSRWQSR